MCIVIVKPKGKKFPKLENIINSCDSNPNGFSMAWNFNNRLETFRTLSEKEFLTKYKQIMMLPKKKTGLIVHARIATHGSISLKNCHCWVDSGLAFAHNGILQIPVANDMTDSETFFRDYIIPCFKYGGWPLVEKMINKYLTWDKMAMIDKSGNIHTFGNFIRENGCLYSNASYVSYKQMYYKEPNYYKDYCKNNNVDINWDDWIENIY